MDDAPVMGIGQRFAKVDADERCQLAGNHAALLQQCGQGSPLHELGDDEAVFGIQTGVVKDLEDVVVVEVFDGARLAGEALTVPNAGGEVRVKDLDGNHAFEGVVAPQVHRGHAAFADLLQDLVLVDC